LMVFRRITFPLIKPGIIAGVILSFTRSLGETGATLAVVPRALTAPVYIVDLVKAGNYQAAGTSCIVLLAVSALLLYMLKRGVYAQSGT
ncbi:MAG TPA: ABC transporter permease subunit, partial [Candidatus Bathyarchaeota archaeon]|nr:ABC transporter permease subunit [Candidatus Bathyarchaeota archaeon]